MLRNYLKIAWRNLLNNRIYSLINISGLAIGLAVCMLIVLYVGHESNYDSFHKNADRIGWAQAKIKAGADSVFIPLTPYQSGPAVLQNLQTVNSFVRIRNGEKNTVITNKEESSQKFFEENFAFADSNFFNFFSFPLVYGNATNVLAQPFSVVLTESSAKKYFGDQNPLGKLLVYNGSHTLQVTGVAKDLPSNSSIRFDMVASLSSMLSIDAFKKDIADERGLFLTYFMANSQKEFPNIVSTLARLEAASESGPVTTRYLVTPLRDIHLEANFGDRSNTKYLNLFPVVAGIILLLALINYMSLSTARSSARAKEIGVRRVLGAERKMIASQFFVESAIYTVVGFIAAFVLFQASQKTFFSYLELNIDSSYSLQPRVLASFALLFVLSVVVSGSYPAILLSGFKPVSVLYGKLSKQRGGITVRKYFTVIQFGLSLVLIVCAIAINRQLFFMRNADTGVNRENIVSIPFGEAAGARFSAFREEIRQLGPVLQTSVSSQPLYKGFDMMGVRFPDSEKMIMLPVYDVEPTFITMLKLRWKLPPGDSLYFRQRDIAVVNESALSKLELGTNPLNKKIDDRLKVAGVLNDFNYSSLEHRVQALALIVNPDDSNASWRKRGGHLLIQTAANTNLQVLIAQLQTIHEKYDTNQPFTYSFLDETYEKLYRSEERLAKTLSVFTGFTILIACLGLFGLATFMAVQRTKEIGIRKVLGASITQIVYILSRDFFRLLLIAVLIGSPIAWYLVNNWLTGFAYRIDLSWWYFATSAILLLLIAVLTIAYHSVKSALANPVKSIRTE